MTDIEEENLEKYCAIARWRGFNEMIKIEPTFKGRMFFRYMRELSAQEVVRRGGEVKRLPGSIEFTLEDIIEGVSL